MNLDAAVNVVRYANEQNQIKRLLTCFGFDPSNPDWPSAFLKLARLYCNVGRLAVHRPSGSSGNSNAKTWTTKAEIELLMQVRRLTQEGLSENEAIRLLGEDPAYDTAFPHQERRLVREIKRRAPADEWHEGSRTERIARLRQPRVAALRKHYQLLKKKAPGSLLRALRGSLPESNSEFELSLWWLLNAEQLEEADSLPRRESVGQKSRRQSVGNRL
jgi:hypothetical protein